MFGGGSETAGENTQRETRRKKMGRSPCCDESGLKKGPWTPEEDQKLVKHIQKHGHGSWRALPKLAGLNRCGKSCRLRWTNYLRPDIKRGKFTQEEEQTILNLHSVLGNKWSAIATHLPGRTDNEIKNFWNTHLKKKLIQMGFDPMTHRPRTDIFSSLPHLIALANLKELLESQTWEEQAVRLQTEAAQMAKLQSLQYLLQPPPNIISEMDTFSLLNSLSSMKDSDDHSLVMNTNQFETHVPNHSSSSSSLQSLQDTINFSHMPDLQIPCGFQTLVDKDQDNMVQPYSHHHETQNSSPSTSSPWFPSTSSLVTAPLMITKANSTNNSGGGGGDACSTNSSYEGGGLSSSLFWPEVLLEDTLFNELAS